MNKSDRIKIAQETMSIYKKGFYINPNGDKIPLETGNKRTIYAVDLYSPNKLVSVMKRADEIRQKSSKGGKCNFILIDADSFNAAEALTNPLVMNFANAHHVGGGFLNGASAQEEALCRMSTLYASISSKKAARMYEYNNQLNSNVDSDYFLISPNVIVFRSSLELSLRLKTYMVSVATIAAPNRNGRAKDVPKEELNRVMTDRLRKLLYTAADNNYRELVLGAWGCGAFGNDPNDVAGYFYQLLFEENLSEMFDRIVFAILGGGKNYEAFKNIFGEKIKDYSEIKHKKSPAKYTELNYLFPQCNHLVKDEKLNLGFTQGIFSDGVPFEAELWENTEEMRAISVVFPELETIKADETITGENTDNDDEYFQMYWEGDNIIDDRSILRYEMKRKDDMEAELYGKYVNYLEEMGIITIVANMSNGYGTHYTDFYGNKYVNITVLLDEKGEKLAETQLNFRKFFTSSIFDKK